MIIFILNHSQIIRSIARVDRAQALEVTTETEVRVTIQEIKIDGSTVFTPEELQEIVAAYIGKEVNSLVLREIRKVLTREYVERGYLTSGAYLPPQDLTDGSIEIKIIEGKLSEVQILGLERVPREYLLDRLPLTSPLNVSELEAALDLLRINPLFEDLKADLREGGALGASILKIDVTEAPNYSVNLQFDNYESPAIGEYQGTVGFYANNFLGYADALDLGYSFTEGTDKVRINYQFPLDSKGATISIGYSNGDNRIVERFEELKIRAESEKIALSIVKPLIYTAKETFSLSFDFDILNTATFILDDIPFSFSEGAREGETKVAALRFGQQWVSRSPERIFALDSRFSISLGILGATDNESGLDGQFFAWQGRFQYLEKLEDRFILSFRSNLQLSGDDLLTIEQFDGGGINSVRGYRSNQIFGDSGFTSTLEVNYRPTDWLTLSPFVDFGTLIDGDLETNTIASLGLSLKAQSDWGFVRIDYAAPLVDVEKGDSLQEEGLLIGAGLTVKF